MQDLPVILRWHYSQSLEKALDLFIEFRFCEGDFYFLNGSKTCMVATYNFGSVYITLRCIEDTFSCRKNYLFLLKKKLL